MGSSSEDMERRRPPAPPHPPPLLMMTLMLALLGTVTAEAAGRPDASTQIDGDHVIRWWQPEEDARLPDAVPISQKIAQPSAKLNAADFDCMSNLGLEDGTILDANITGLPNVSYPGAPEYSSPAGARLNSATAWCVNASAFPETHATLTIDLGAYRLVSGFKVQAAPTEVHSRDSSSIATFEYSLDGTSWTACCSMETLGVSQAFAILPPQDTLETAREYYFGALKLAKYVRFRFDKSSWPQEVQCVRLELIGCQEGWLPTPRIWNVADARGWLDIMWQPLQAKIHDGERPITFRLPVQRFALNVMHQENSQVMSDLAETSSARWSITRPLWGEVYVVQITVKMAGVPLPWAQYTVRAKLSCPDGQQRCAFDDAVFELPDVLKSSWRGANSTLVTSWTMMSGGWRVPYFMFSVIVSDAGTGVTNQIIESSVVEREMSDLASDQDYEVFISPVIPELTSSPSYHRKVMLVSASSSGEKLKLAKLKLAKMVDSESAASSSVSAVTADVSLRAWPLWSGQILARWDAAVLRGDAGETPAIGYLLTVSAYDQQLYSAALPGDVLEARYTGSLAVDTEYEVEVWCIFPTRNFSCGLVTVVPTAPAAAERTDSGWRVYDVPAPPSSWAEAERTCQRRGGHLVSITSNERQLLLTAMLERLGLSQVWMGLSVCEPFTGSWSDGTRARFDETGAPPASAAGECCTKLFRTEDVVSGTVSYQWRMALCDAVMPPVCASEVEGEMLHPVENLTARSEQPLTLDLRWQPRATGWAPSFCHIQVCPTKNLAQPLKPLSLPCTNWTSSDGRSAYISGLPGYYEYRVSVWSALASIRSQRAANVTARSMPLLPLSVSITQSGLLTAAWRRKVVEGVADAQADVVVRKLDTAAPPSPSVQELSQAMVVAQRTAAMATTRPASAEILAVTPATRRSTDTVRRQHSQKIRWSGLELSARYLLALFDVGANSTTDYIVFSASPTCMPGEYQLGSLCFWPSPSTARYSEAPNQCAGATDSSTTTSSLRARPWVALIATAEEYRLVKNISQVLNKSFWVVQREKRRRRRRRDLAGQPVESADDVEVVPGYTTLQSSTGDPQWGKRRRRRRGELSGKHVESEENVELLPGYQLPAAPPSPNPHAVIISEDLAEDLAEGGAEDFSETQAGADSGVEFSDAPKPCAYVQKERNGVQISTSSCEEEMQAMCSTNISVTLPEFAEQDLRIQPSSTSIRIDWFVPEAWSASYLVSVSKRPPPTASGDGVEQAGAEQDVRIKRAVAGDTYTAPPVVLNDLEENALYEVTISRQSAGRLTTVGPIVVRALDPPKQPSMFPVDDGARLCLALSYVLVIVTGLTVAIILLLARVSVPEGVYQITLAVTLAILYLFLLLSHGGPLSESSPAGCSAAAATIHLGFSVALAAVLLLALALPRLLGAVTHGFPGKHAWAVPLVAAGPQAVVVMLLIAAAGGAKGYVGSTPQKTCWLELDVENAVMWVTVCHLVIIWLAGLVLSLRVLMLDADKLPPPPKHAEKVKRKSALGRLRFAALVLLVLLAGCWSLGATASFYGDPALVISETVFTVLLAAALGWLCADTFVIGSRPWSQRVTPQQQPVQRLGGRPPANLKLTTVHPAGGDGNMLIKRTFHFGANTAEADKGMLFTMPTPE